MIEMKCKGKKKGGKKGGKGGKYWLRTSDYYPPPNLPITNEATF